MTEWVEDENEDEDYEPPRKREPIDNVRLFSQVLFWAGCVSLGVSVILIMTSLVTMPGPQPFSAEPLIITVLSRLFGLLVPILVFTAWGALTALCEIHDRLAELKGVEEE